MDVCVATCCARDVRCLDILLYSLEKFADLASCNLLVTHNSADTSVREMLVRICESYHTTSLSIDFFDPKETVDSNQHAEALNRLIASTTSDHVIFADADVILTSSNWLSFCTQLVNQGCFIVGTQYPSHHLMWQGRFPNLWCAMLDGKALRSAKLDMRTTHTQFNTKKNKWVLSNVEKNKARDASWELADHAFRNKLDWISLSPGIGMLSTGMRSWTSPSAILQKRIGQAGKCLQKLRPREFKNPETGELFCAHLCNGALRGFGTSRSDQWISCAKVAVDYAEQVELS